MAAFSPTWWPGTWLRPQGRQVGLPVSSPKPAVKMGVDWVSRGTSFLGQPTILVLKVGSRRPLPQPCLARTLCGLGQAPTWSGVCAGAEGSALAQEPEAQLREEESGMDGPGTARNMGQEDPCWSNCPGPWSLLLFVPLPAPSLVVGDWKMHF